MFFILRLYKNLRVQLHPFSGVHELSFVESSLKNTSVKAWRRFITSGNRRSECSFLNLDTKAFHCLTLVSSLYTFSEKTTGVFFGIGVDLLSNVSLIAFFTVL